MSIQLCFPTVYNKVNLLEKIKNKQILYLQNHTLFECKS